jgi:hypothetical protein
VLVCGLRSLLVSLFWPIQAAVQIFYSIWTPAVFFVFCAGEDFVFAADCSICCFIFGRHRPRPIQSGFVHAPVDLARSGFRSCTRKRAASICSSGAGLVRRSVPGFFVLARGLSAPVSSLPLKRAEGIECARPEIRALSAGQDSRAGVLVFGAPCVSRRDFPRHLISAAAVICSSKFSFPAGSRSRTGAALICDSRFQLARSESVRSPVAASASVSLGARCGVLSPLL